MQSSEYPDPTPSIFQLHLVRPINPSVILSRSQQIAYASDHMNLFEYTCRHSRKILRRMSRMSKKQLHDFCQKLMADALEMLEIDLSPYFSIQIQIEFNLSLLSHITPFLFLAKRNNCLWVCRSSTIWGIVLPQKVPSHVASMPRTNEEILATFAQVLQLPADSDTMIALNKALTTIQVTAADLTSCNAITFGTQDCTLE